MPVRTRLAPTPSGYLHPGNGVSFALTWALARAASGSVLLRIDDLDRARFRIEFVEDIFRTLDWLGLDWDEGPQSPDDFFAHFSQTLRIEIYESALHKLSASGLIYACDCSRKQIREQTADGHYPGFCSARQLDLSIPAAAWRAKLPEPCIVKINTWREPNPYAVDLKNVMGDFVLRQKDGAPAYQIASLCDDIHWNINFVVRGEDLLYSTAAQVWLATQLSALSFQKITFFHHPLITDMRGEKLSKSAGAAALVNWRTSGQHPKAIFALAAQWLGLDVQPETAQELKELVQKYYAKFEMPDTA
jgi:glutamyl/glutaminyl-tRNA synthetase